MGKTRRGKRTNTDMTEYSSESRSAYSGSDEDSNDNDLVQEHSEYAAYGEEDSHRKYWCALPDNSGESMVHHFVGNKDKFLCLYCEKSIARSNISDHLLRCKLNVVSNDDRRQKKLAYDRQRMQKHLRKNRFEQKKKSIYQMLRQPTRTVFVFYHFDIFNVNISNPFYAPPGKIPTTFHLGAEMRNLYKEKLIVRLIHNFLLRSIQELNITKCEGFGLTACSRLLTIFKQFDPYKHSVYKQFFQTNVRIPESLSAAVRKYSEISIFLSFVNIFNFHITC